MVQLKSVIDNRQRVTLHALQRLTETDVRHDSPWQGMFGASAVALVTGQSRGKVGNDLATLEAVGFVERGMNQLYRITAAGRDYLVAEKLDKAGF